MQHIYLTNTFTQKTYLQNITTINLFFSCQQVSGNAAVLPKVIMYAFDSFLQIGLPCWFATQLRVQVRSLRSLTNTHTHTHTHIRSVKVHTRTTFI